MRFPFDRRVWFGTAVIVAAMGLLYFWTQFLWILGVGLGILVLHFAFFRDPERKIPSHQNEVYSPADGVISSIETIYEGRYIQAECVRIRIFLSIFNVHVNRAPVRGVVDYVEYVPGGFYNALRKRAYEENESNWIGLDCGDKKILFRQIAGAIARRICCDIKPGQVLEQGSRFGVICYGSGMEVYVPKAIFEPSVKVGDKVFGARSVLGFLKSPTGK